MNMLNRKKIGSYILKKILFSLIGIITYPLINIFNKLTTKGLSQLKELPQKNVLFVSNHQTYFLDVITFNHICCAAKWGKKKGIGLPYYLLNPFVNIYYVAATITMQSNWMTKIFTLAGGITVKRAWNEKSGEKQTGLGIGDTRNITRALENSWVITFPQGTTTPFAPGRKGTALIIKQNKPIVVPLVISGFSEAFSKDGLKLKKKGVKLHVEIKEPLPIDYDAPTEVIHEQIMDAIEQSEKFAK